jgi:hypothetical protein
MKKKGYETRKRKKTKPMIHIILKIEVEAVENSYRRKGQIVEKFHAGERELAISLCFLLPQLRGCQSIV